MKKLILVFAVVLGLSAMKANAQYVRVRPNFSIGVHIGAPNPAPYTGAIWVAPEWRWRGGRYVEVPGHWERPHRHRDMWVPGHWQDTRRGYRWIPGHWR